MPMKRSFSAERLDSYMESEGEPLGEVGDLQDLTDAYLDAIGDLTEAMDVVGRLVAHLEGEDCARCRIRLERWRNTLAAAKRRVELAEEAWWVKHDQGLCTGKKKPSVPDLERAACGPEAHETLTALLTEAVQYDMCEADAAAPPDVVM